MTLTLSADQKAVESILAEGPIVRGVLKGVDAEKHTLAISMAQGRGEPAARPGQHDGEVPFCGKE